MRTPRNFLLVPLICLLAASLPSAAQVVVATVPTGRGPLGIAINQVTNKTYVADYCGNSCGTLGTVTVIDGATNTTTTINVGAYPQAVAVNPATNKIYVVNSCGNDLKCASLGTVTVIDAGNNNSTATVTVGFSPDAVAVNAATNQIYVVNYCGSDRNCVSNGTVTVIDGASNNTSTVNVDDYPEAVVVNATTNKIYVANSCGTGGVPCNTGGTVTAIDANNMNNTARVNVGFLPHYLTLNAVTNQIYVSNNCGNDVTCGSPGTVTVIDGASNNTSTVNVGDFPYEIAANSATNQIYVVNKCGNDISCNSLGTVTVIDANNNNNTASVEVGYKPTYLDIDTITNEVYVPNLCRAVGTCASPGTVTVIYGAANNTAQVTVGDSPVGVAVNSVTNRIYIPNSTDQTASIIAGDTALQFVNVTPCRLEDTRQVSGGGGPIPGGSFETFNLVQLAQKKNCSDLSSASAFSLNVTVVPQQPLGYLTIWPGGQNQPNVSTLNSLDARVKANAAIVTSGVSGTVSVFVSNTSDVILDIDGYFTLAGQSTLAFYTLPPCRVADTRNANLPSGLGPPYMKGGVARDFPILKSNCSIPSNAQAYSFNITAVPRVPLGYLTVWAAGQPQPGVSTLNAFTGTVVANAAIVPAGQGGDIDAFPSNDTDLVIDINGYFAPAGGQNALSLYPVAPCRVIDTRQVGNGQPFVGELTVDVAGSFCAPPTTAQSYVTNATVVPSEGLGYLTLWADGQQQPGVSTLNALDGAVTSNMAIVPVIPADGKIDAFATNLTQLIVDLYSYFAP